MGPKQLKPKNDSNRFKPEAPCLVPKQQVFKPLQHFGLCDKPGKQNVNIITLVHKQKQKKSPNALTPTSEKKDSWQIRLWCRYLCHHRREGCYLPANISEGRRVKKPPKCHRCYRKWGMKQTPTPAPGKEPVSTVSVALNTGMGEGKNHRKYACRKTIPIFSPSSFQWPAVSVAFHLFFSIGFLTSKPNTPYFFHSKN